jgi:hypothetical protein
VISQRLILRGVQSILRNWPSNKSSWSTMWGLFSRMNWSLHFSLIICSDSPPCTTYVSPHGHPRKTRPCAPGMALVSTRTKITAVRATIRARATAVAMADVDSANRGSQKYQLDKAKQDTKIRSSSRRCKNKQAQRKAQMRATFANSWQ